MTKTISGWVCLLLMLVPAGMFAPDGGGSPAVNASQRPGPMIYDVYDLQNMSRDLNLSYVLANDIDASVTKDWNGGAGFSPVGDDSGSYMMPVPPFTRFYPNRFKGNFFGNGHTITALYISRPSQSYTGLFGMDQAGCNISDVSLAGVNITGYGNTAGLVGRFFGNMTNCSVNGTVSGYGTVGMLMGSLESGASLSFSSSSGTILGFSSLGGLVGTGSGTISRCFSTADVSGTGSAGGLTGFNSGSISDCHSSGAVTGGYSGGAGAGGFIGEDNRGTMVDCYSAGKVTGSGNIGGFLGKTYNMGVCSDCFWDNLTSGLNNSAAGTGKNTTDMMKKATFANWNFTSTWNILENRTYPFLRNFYRLPVIEGTGETTVKEDAKLSAHYNASISKVPVINDFSWSFATNATGWLSFNATRGNLSGMPDNADVGRYWVNITITDSMGYRCIRNFTLTVENVAPVFTGVPPSNGVSVYQDGNFSFDVDSDDEGLGNTAYGFDQAPEWLKIDAANGVISGSPGNKDVGRQTIFLFVDDGWGGLVDYWFDISVMDINDPPVIISVDVAAATQGIPYRVVYQASDIDPTKETFSWSLGTNASWLDMDAATGLLAGIPGNADVGAWWVNITVDDGRGGRDRRNFTVTVGNVNDPPVIMTVPVVTATEGSPYLVNFSAQDPDAGDVISWSLTADADWLSINSSSGVLSGTPTEKDVGSVWVSVTARDMAGANDTVGFNLKVLNVNDPPVWVAVPPDQNITEGASLFLDVLAADPDADATVRYSASSLPASGIAINPVSGAIRWMDASAGNYTVTVYATDGLLTINATFNVTVKRIQPPVPPPVNNPPVINTVSSASVKAGQVLTMKLSGSDNDSYDAKNLTFRIVSGPAGMLVSADGNIAWTPTKEEVGSHSVMVSLSDGKNTTATSFTVTVNKPTPAGTGTGGKSDNSIGLIAGMLIVGLAIGAVAVFVALRKKG